MSCAVTAGPRPSVGKFTVRACVVPGVSYFLCRVLLFPSWHHLSLLSWMVRGQSGEWWSGLRWIKKGGPFLMSVVFLKLISPKSPGANSITFHFLLQPLSLVSGATWWPLLNFLKNVLLLHCMNFLPRYKRGSAYYKWKLFSVKLCLSSLASIKHTLFFPLSVIGNLCAGRDSLPIPFLCSSSTLQASPLITEETSQPPPNTRLFLGLR